MHEYSIRPAIEADAPTIRRMVMAERLDPTSLDWRHFLVAERDRQIVGIGQIKDYPGAQELGSLVVLPAYRGQGIAAALIAALEARAGRPLYLLCQDKMTTYYAQFGYRTIAWLDAPVILKLKLLPTLLFRLFGVRIRVMRKG
jgi:amino-acid N-acetyltransferase